ncbi:MULTISPECIES: YiiD C-terminal domain-containing protein [Kordiimonas]|jgi:thioesterase domain-containing protein|uniref:YiiD C-terminal domain-containing protein n=1 Tax=Kordiimonas TaxID=288021 RepID=UPI00257F5F96|nr:YiiD C-terminal domain-containing protein [Kordiimonas sp. UBA4487]
MKSPEALEDYLYRNIPISEAMGVRVARASTDSISLTAPLQANINHKRTAFGGSLQAVATLACWTLLHVNLREDADPSEIVITNSNIDYIRPVTADFTATATLPDGARWQQFLKTFDRHGRARIQLTAHVMQDDDVAIDYTGTFAALKTG